MTTGLIITHNNSVRDEELIIRSFDKQKYIIVCKGTRRDILRYADEHNIKIIY